MDLFLFKQEEKGLLIPCSSFGEVWGLVFLPRKARKNTKSSDAGFRVQLLTRQAGARRSEGGGIDNPFVRRWIARKLALGEYHFPLLMLFALNIQEGEWS